MRREELESRTMEFGVAAFRLCRLLRDLPGGRGPAGQLVDCATSIGANYRATSRSRSQAEFVARLSVVVEEADEAVFWLEFFHRAGVPDLESVQQLLGEAMELRAIFAAGCRTARRGSKVARRR